MLGGDRIIGTIMGRFMVGMSIMDNTIRTKIDMLVPKDGRVKDYLEAGIPEELQRMGRMILLGEDRVEAYKKTHPDAKSEKYIKTRVGTITRNKYFENYMSEEFTKLLEKKEMTKDWGLGVLKSIADDPKAPAGVRKEIVDDVLVDHGERKEQKQVTEHTWHATHQVSDGELSDIKKLKESKKTDITKRED